MTRYEAWARWVPEMQRPAVSRLSSPAGKQAPVRDIVARRRRGLPLGLSASRRVVDVDEEPGVVHDHVRELRTCFHVAIAQHVVADDPPRFAYPQGRSRAPHAAGLVARHLFPQKRDDHLDLRAQLDFGARDAGKRERVESVRLCRVHVPLTCVKGFVQPDDRDVLRQLAPLARMPAHFGVPPAVGQGHVVRFAEAKDGAALVHAGQGELQGRGLNAPVRFPADLAACA